MPSILITGGTGKLGRVLVGHFLKLGWSVVFTSRRTEGVEELKDEFEGHHALRGFILDLSDDSSIERLIGDLDKACIPVDYLVNNARKLESLRIGNDGITARPDFMAELLVDVVAPYELSMALTQTGSLQGVVNIGSMYGLVAPNLKLYENPDQESPIQYGVAKAALIQLTRELAVRLAPRGVRVNCIAYGGFEGRARSEFVDRYEKLTPTRRMLHAEEFSGPVEFLCGSASSGMTGHTLVVDGGWTAW